MDEDLDRFIAIARRDASMIKRTCNSPAPLVVNGVGFAGCQEDFGHFPASPHKFTIRWQ